MWHPELGFAHERRGNINQRDRAAPDLGLSEGCRFQRPDVRQTGPIDHLRSGSATCDAHRIRTEPSPYWLQRSKDGDSTSLARPDDGFEESYLHLLNDPQLTAIALDMEIVDGEGRKVEGVYRIDVDGTVTRIITHEVDRPNGLVVTADDKFLLRRRQ